jgi:hypothetical protein
MRSIPAQNIRRCLHGLNDKKRLASVVKTMAAELKRLNEDNAQLRAAVEMYREVLRRSVPRAR